MLIGDFPPGYFKDRIVFVGQRVTAGHSGSVKDDFRTPYSEWGIEAAPGVDFHATATLNFLHHNWLDRLPSPVETMVVLLVALISGIGLVRLQPLWATGAAIAGMLLVALAAHLLAWNADVWFSWVIAV